MGQTPRFTERISRLYLEQKHKYTR